MKILIAILMCMTISGCDLHPLRRYDQEKFESFKSTPAWDAAKAIKSEDTEELQKIVKRNPNLINFTSPAKQETLLTLAVSLNKFQATKVLLLSGANTNLRNSEGITPLYTAVQHSNHEGEKFVVLLLKHQADPNMFASSNNEKLNSESPLMLAASWGDLSIVKILVDNGADINVRSPTGNKCNALSEPITMEVLHYLIVEKHANVKTTDCIYEPKPGELPPKKIVDMVRQRMTGIDLYRNDPSKSETEREYLNKDYKTGMEIVNYLKSVGEDY